MSKNLEIHVERDHLISLTKVNGTTAIAELIWNSLDADAKNIEIKYIKNEIRIDSIEVIDDGHGIAIDTALKAFQSLGGSNKKFSVFSPGHRALHGKEGKGRLKVFALGDLVTFSSSYYDSNIDRYKFFSIKMDKSQINRAFVSDQIENSEINKSGVQVTIDNIDQDNALSVFAEKGLNNLEEKFAVYYKSYPNFRISLNGIELKFNNLIKNIYEDFFTQTIEIGGKENSYEFKVEIIEWKKLREQKKLHFCNNNGITYSDESLGIRTSGYNITVHLLSDYVEYLYKDNTLDLRESNDSMQNVITKTKDIVRKYIRERKHKESKNYIDELKNENLYPFAKEPEDEVEKANRQVFDIVALQINDHVPEFNQQSNRSKKFTLSLVKEALEKNTSSLQHILEEVVQLPKDKQEDLRDILEQTSLSVIVDTMKEITDRLRTIYEFRLMLFDKEWKKKIKERKHLHKILREETWLFGDDFTYGADDITLKNVLKEYLKYLDRENFQEIIEESPNDQLQDIPDICLWKQFGLGKVGHHHNLVIELKRPSKKIGEKEISQIKKYANSVSNDDRFPKSKTNWTFYLLALDLDEYAEIECNQSDRDFGHIAVRENINVFVKKWGDLLNEAEARHQFLKEKLNYNITEDEEGIRLLRKKYDKYLPEEKKEDINEYHILDKKIIKH